MPGILSDYTRMCTACLIIESVIRVGRIQREWKAGDARLKPRPDAAVTSMQDRLALHGKRWNECNKKRNSNLDGAGTARHDSGRPLTVHSATNMNHSIQLSVVEPRHPLDHRAECCVISVSGDCSRWCRIASNFNAGYVCWTHR